MPQSRADTDDRVMTVATPILVNAASCILCAALAIGSGMGVLAGLGLGVLGGAVLTFVILGLLLWRAEGAPRRPAPHDPAPATGARPWG
jgi:hypothetical protein